MINEIPQNIKDYVEYDETSSTFLKWKKAAGKRGIIGNEAGCLNKITGYYETRFNRKKYKNHRIIFFLHHGYCPDILDHIDNNRQNNNIYNLREASISQNNHNSRIPKNNTTGVKGLSIMKTKNYPELEYWKLQIKNNGKLVFQEIYKLIEKTKDECRIILEEKRKELHGQFSNNG